MYKPLSEPQEAWHFDFRDSPASSERKQLDVTFTAEGRFSAVLFWFTLDLGSGVQLSSAPDAGELWSSCCHYSANECKQLDLVPGALQRGALLVYPGPGLRRAAVHSS